MAQVLKFPDPEERSRNPDAVQRPYDEPATIIILPPDPDFERRRLERSIMRRYEEARAFYLSAWAVPLLLAADFMLPRLDA